MSFTNPTVFQSKGEQSKAVATVSPNVTAIDPSVLAASYITAPIVADNTPQTLLQKAKTFLTTPITPGSKIQYWHVGAAVIVLFVLYVEMMADRKTQRKLKFW